MCLFHHLWRMVASVHGVDFSVMFTIQLMIRFLIANLNFLGCRQSIWAKYYVCCTLHDLSELG